MIEREHRAVFSDQLRQRRRGRPRVNARMELASVRLPEPVFDALCRLAMQRRQGVSELLRDVVSSFVRSSN